MPIRSTWTIRLVLPGVVGLLLAAALPDVTHAQSPGRLPFSDYQGPRGMSPYNALGFQGNNPTTGATLGAFQNIVRPQQLQASQLQQQQLQGRQLNGLQNQVRSMQRGAAQPAESTIRATGHQATFMNRSHYYPQ
jgi:hypothetical protein